jgi:hypothetical protein
MYVNVSKDSQLTLAFGSFNDSGCQLWKHYDRSNELQSNLAASSSKRKRASLAGLLLAMILTRLKIPLFLVYQELFSVIGLDILLIYYNDDYIYADGSISLVDHDFVEIS